VLTALFALVASSFRTRAALHAEILALRRQLAVCQKHAPRRLRLHRCDRLLWVVLYRFWSCGTQNSIRLPCDRDAGTYLFGLSEHKALTGFSAYLDHRYGSGRASFLPSAIPLAHSAERGGPVPAKATGLLMRRDKSNRDDWTTLPLSLLSSGLAYVIGKRPWSSSNPRP